VNELIKLINILKEYSKKVYPDYDRGTVLTHFPKKFYQDLLSNIEKLNTDIVYKTEINQKEYLVVLAPSYDDTHNFFASLSSSAIDDED
jgi:hypothetical protein